MSSNSLDFLGGEPGLLKLWKSNASCNFTTVSCIYCTSNTWHRLWRKGRPCGLAYFTNKIDFLCFFSHSTSGIWREITTLRPYIFGIRSHDFSFYFIFLLSLPRIPFKVEILSIYLGCQVAWYWLHLQWGYLKVSTFVFITGHCKIVWFDFQVLISVCANTTFVGEVIIEIWDAICWRGNYWNMRCHMLKR